MNPPTFPARPVNGGPLDRALPKRGSWLVEPKYNGWRVLVHVPTGAMFNRHLEPLSIASEFTNALSELRDGLNKSLERLSHPDPYRSKKLSEAEIEWADCEGLERRHNRGRGSLIVLDLPMLKIQLWQRSMMLRKTFCSAIDHCPSPNTVYSVPQWTDASVVWSALKQDNRELGCEFYEGVVMKRADSLYPIQLRRAEQECTAWVKHRWKF